MLTLDMLLHTVPNLATLSLCLDMYNIPILPMRPEDISIFVEHYRAVMEASEGILLEDQLAKNNAATFLSQNPQANIVSIFDFVSKWPNAADITVIDAYIAVQRPADRYVWTLINQKGVIRKAGGVYNVCENTVSIWKSKHVQHVFAGVKNTATTPTRVLMQCSKSLHDIPNFKEYVQNTAVALLKRSGGN